ncbi:UNVERIFIED_CONTAM: hypothetical protein Scaly_2907700 [Sesamum calycinum]|uniref:Endonuclease/exonuclease/phosphatase domain-containing protein n=1 Tax=Sesamum calycinum TaxID=2727403 RepID=A0AAW2L6R0_9LAMI
MCSEYGLIFYIIGHGLRTILVRLGEYGWLGTHWKSVWKILRVETQIIHCRAFNKRTHTRCLVSVLYGDYDLIPRRDLWGALRTLSTGILEEPWLVLGDFNAVIDDSEVCGRAADTSASMAEFRSCIFDKGLVHLPSTGCPFTWHNCSEGTRSLWKCLDKILVNEAWLETWPGASYLCLTEYLGSFSTCPYRHTQRC